MSNSNVADLELGKVTYDNSVLNQLPNYNNTSSASVMDPDADAPAISTNFEATVSSPRYSNQDINSPDQETATSDGYYDPPGKDTGTEDDDRQMRHEDETQVSSWADRVDNISSHSSKTPVIDKTTAKMYYKIEDIPSWYLTIFLAFQHYLLMAGATLSVPLVLTPKMCMRPYDPDQGNIISTILFVSGIVTILQSTFGARLPIVQGGSFTFIVPALAILNSPRWSCPPGEEIDQMKGPERTELWQVRMREISGAIIVSSLMQIFLGFFGVFGLIIQYVTPITMASAIIVIGLSLFEVASILSSTNWLISLLTILMIILFSQYLRNVKIPIPFTKSKKRSGNIKYPMFQVFPVLLTIISVWGLSAILTSCDVFSPKSEARTDVKLSIVSKSASFRVPYPFQWGAPTVSAGAVIGFLSAVFAGILESLGEYHACARIVGAPEPPKHAINRGILMEGLGCMLAGIFGTGNGTTSYSENTGAMNITKVGSRRVIQAAGFIMMVCSLFGKLGAFFVSIPTPIIGGILCVTFAVIISVGLSNLHSVDLTSSRNIFILGFSIFFSLTVSKWMGNNKGTIKLGYAELNSTVEILLSTGMFLAGVISFILDNTVPGTPEERGIARKSNSKLDKSQTKEEGDMADITYDLPFGMNLMRKYSWTSWVPILPTYASSNYQTLFYRKPRNLNV